MEDSMEKVKDRTAALYNLFALQAKTHSIFLFWKKAEASRG
jgi:hypothetical protein